MFRRNHGVGIGFPDDEIICDPNPRDAEPAECYWMRSHAETEVDAVGFLSESSSDQTMLGF